MVARNVSVALQMNANGQQVISEFNKVSKAVGKMEKNFARLQKQASRATREVSRMRQGLGQLASIAATAFGVHAIRGVIEYGDQLAKTARRVGVTADTLQTLQYAAESLEIPMKQVSSGLIRLQANLGDLNLSSNELRTALLDLDEGLIDVFKQAKSTEEVFEIWLDVMKRTNDATKQLTLTNALFGKRAGASFLQIFREGGDALEQFKGRREELNAIIGKDTLDKMEIANQAFTDMKHTLLAAGVAIVSYLAPALRELASLLAAASTAAGGIADKVGGFFERAVNAVANSVYGGGAGRDLTQLSDEDLLSQYERKRRELAEATNDRTRRLRTEEVAALMTEIQLRETVNKAIEEKNKLLEEAASSGDSGSDDAAARRAAQREAERQAQLAEERRINRIRTARDSVEAIERSFEGVEQRLREHIPALEAEQERYHTYLNNLNRIAHDEQVAQQESLAEKQRQIHDERLRQIEEQNEKLREQKERVAALAEEYGGRLVDAMLNGANAADTLRAILIDVLKQLVRQLIVTQIIQAVTGAFSGSPAPINNQFSNIGSGFGNAASGGRIADGGLVRVGEAGPELVALPKGAEVYPRGDLSGKGRGDTIINVNGVQDPVTVENAIRRASADIEQNVLAKIERNKGLPGIARNAYA